MNNFLIYWLVSGLIITASTYIDYNFIKEEDILEAISNASWHLGIPEDRLMILIYCICMVLGGFLLPYSIFCKLYKLITGRKFME